MIRGKVSFQSTSRLEHRSIVERLLHTHRFSVSTSTRYRRAHESIQLLSEITASDEPLSHSSDELHATDERGIDRPTSRRSTSDRFHCASFLVARGSSRGPLPCFDAPFVSYDASSKRLDTREPHGHPVHSSSTNHGESRLDSPINRREPSSIHSLPPSSWCLITTGRYSRTPARRQLDFHSHARETVKSARRAETEGDTRLRKVESMPGLRDARRQSGSAATTC